MELDDDTRERLHRVLSYLLESEAHDYWHKREPAAREGHVYAKALALVNTFGFEDLARADAAVRAGTCFFERDEAGNVVAVPVVEPGDQPPWLLVRAGDEMLAGVESAEHLVEAAGVLAEVDRVKWGREAGAAWLTLAEGAEPVAAGGYVLVCGPSALKVELLEDAQPDRPAPFRVLPSKEG